MTDIPFTYFGILFRLCNQRIHILGVAQYTFVHTVVLKARYCVFQALRLAYQLCLLIASLLSSIAFQDRIVMSFSVVQHDFARLYIDKTVCCLRNKHINLQLNIISTYSIYAAAFEISNAPDRLIFIK